LITLEAFDDPTNTCRLKITRRRGFGKPDPQFIEVGMFVIGSRPPLAMADDRGHTGCCQRGNGDAGQHAAGCLRHVRSCLLEQGADGFRPSDTVSHEGARFDAMATVVLRVRLTGGERMDVTYEEPRTSDEEELVEHVVSTLAEDSGVLRCGHGDRLVILYGRGVAAIEVAPRGAVL
jgi:hypothetical protein